ncbi:MAG TPA: hypothetical protein VMZ53_14215 [Kofleriaceae bacterium]|nr:hypothetical protein [Kofleriaceae bacterium]
MQKSLRIGFALCVLVGCGDDAATTPDSPTGNRPPPRAISGGGIGDGAIDGVVNLYVMDDATRMPLANATVRVGTLDGTTDATGLFVAEGVVGPQTVLAKLAGYRSEMWIGANGANMTVSLKPDVDPTPARAKLSGSITGFDQLTVPTGHRKAAIVTYSNDDKAGDAANNIDTANATNICDAGTGMPCNFSITTRTGTVALIAIVYDHDTKNTLTPNDDTYTPITWAYKTGISVAGGVDQTGIALSLVDAADLANVIVDFGTPPAGMANIAAVIGIEVGSSGTMQLVPSFATQSAPTVLAPKLSAISGATYRLTAIAQNGNTELDPGSFVLHRAQTSTSLGAGTWLGVPSGVTLTRTTASWTAVPGAALQGVEYDIDKTHHVLSITSFDGSTSATIPELLALPSSPLVGRVTALQGTVDLMDFSVDDVLTKITGFSAQPLQIN